MEIKLSYYEGVNLSIEDIFGPDALKAGKGMEFTSLINKEKVKESGTPASQRVYTIQIMALKKPKDAGYFNNTGQVTQHTCKDGLYRYVVGEYQGIQEAIIMNINHYRKISLNGE